MGVIFVKTCPRCGGEYVQERHMGEIVRETWCRCRFLRAVIECCLVTALLVGTLALAGVQW